MTPHDGLSSGYDLGNGGMTMFDAKMITQREPLHEGPPSKWTCRKCRTELGIARPGRQQPSTHAPADGSRGVEVMAHDRSRAPAHDLAETWSIQTPVVHASGISRRGTYPSGCPRRRPRRDSRSGVSRPTAKPSPTPGVELASRLSRTAGA